jgi:hypothetical protein
MGHAHMIKWLILTALVVHLVGGLTGCDAEKEKAQKLGDEVTRDSPGWQRLKEQEALPPEQRQHGIVPPSGPISSNWRK